jgi:hypothetical protein
MYWFMINDNTNKTIEKAKPYKFFLIFFQN